MTNLLELIESGTIKYDYKIKGICKPLQTFFSISNFGYYRIEENGNFIALGNNVDHLLFYYTQKLYLNERYLVHPNLLRPGYVIVPCTFSNEKLQMCREHYKVDHLVLILKKSQKSIEGFIFAKDEMDIKRSVTLISKIELLQKFIGHFKQECKALINKLSREGYNLMEEKKEAFFKTDPILELSNCTMSKNFLKGVFPLTSREKQCFDLFKQGFSAQSTAAFLGISKRTAEVHCEKIKKKLDCVSKSELLDW